MATTSFNAYGAFIPRPQATSTSPLLAMQQWLAMRLNQNAPQISRRWQRILALLLIVATGAFVTLNMSWFLNPYASQQKPREVAFTVSKDRPLKVLAPPAGQQKQLPHDAGAAPVGVHPLSAAMGEHAPPASQPKVKDQEKMDFVKEMLLHAWNGYREHAWGGDDLSPLSHTAYNWYGGDYTLLNTAVDALSTLWIMGLHDEYADAKTAVLNRFLPLASRGDSGGGDGGGGGGGGVDRDPVLARRAPIAAAPKVSLFETTIRVLGGLLAAYDLEGEQTLLDAARAVADRLMPALEAADGGDLPLNYVDLESGAATDLHGRKDEIFVSQAGSIQLEFQYLSDVTGDPKYAQTVVRIHDRINSITDQVYSIGPNSDSYYEYLLKLYVSTGDQKFLQRYDAAAVTCFAGGMFALGSRLSCGARHASSVSEAAACAAREVDIGRRITDTCYAASTLPGSAGVGFELAALTSAVAGPQRLTLVDPSYDLRPETVESLFYLWRLTGDQTYRDRGWIMAQ
ncbi:hypothetical protein HK405_015121, partial [Cladochytrium tenue]